MKRCYTPETATNVRDLPAPAHVRHPHISRRDVCAPYTDQQSFTRSTSPVAASISTTLQSSGAVGVPV
jgi:hypothetical protein